MQTEKILRMCLIICSVHAMVTPMMAQNDAHRPGKNMFAIGTGVGSPGGDLKQNMSSSPALRLKYGYRFTRNTQVDLGWDTVFHAAGIRGDKRDYEYIVPIGGRVILPLFSESFELFAGAGGAYLRYSEVPAYLGPGPTGVSRDGWGVYGTAGANVALEHRKHAWLGIEAQYLKGATSGKFLETGVESKDRWLITTINLVFRF